MRMVDLGNQRGPLYFIDTPTSVDCTKDVRFRRGFRSLMECMVPYCFTFHPSSDTSSSDSDSAHHGSIVTGTFFGYRRGRVSFCIHADGSRGRASPLFLLDFGVPTSYLAKEMQHGLLRIALVCHQSSTPKSLFKVPTWSMYCNGRKVGFAVRRQMTEADATCFKLMQSVSAAAGVLPGGPKSGEGYLMYLRAGFERVIGSADSESFHMINPIGSTGQELSIFLLRS